MSATAEDMTLTPTIFHEPWWLEIATEGRYQVVEHTERGKVVGRLPYYQYKKYGMNIVGLPPLTNFLGPAVNEGEGKPSTLFLKRLEITNALIAKLPKTSSFYVKCHAEIKEAVAFQSAGFRASVQFTNELHPLPSDKLWSELRVNARNNIRAARDKFDVVESKDAAAFMAFYKSNIEDKGLENDKPVDICTRLIAESIARGRGRILEARENPGGALTAAIFCVWDRKTCYYLMTTHTRTAHRGATKLLVWDAIADAHRRGLVFDFDGVSSEGCARSANDFTALFAPRYILTRESPPMRVLRAVQSVVTEKNAYY